MRAAQVLLTCAALSWPGTANSQQRFIPSASDFGGVGLLQTRTARFGLDGQFDVGYSFIDPYERYLITIQALPWVEATFRYTSVRDRDFQGNAISNDTGSTFKDRGADLKFLLRRESKYVPQIALGLQDGLGTGVFAGEYVVASKRYFDFDFSFGMGWGYSAGAGDIDNPLAKISERFLLRSGTGAGQGGTVQLGTWFGGEKVGLFGGVEYATPLKGLSLKLEYDPNNYESEPLKNPIISVTPWNFGFNYRPFDWVDISVALERGRQYMLRVSLRSDVSLPGLPKVDPPPPPLRPRPPAPEPVQAARGAFPDSVTVSLTDWADPLGQRRVEPVREFSVAGLRSVGNGETARHLSPSPAALASASPPAIRSGWHDGASNRDPYQEDAILAFLFEDLESNGIFVDSFDTSGMTATVRMAILPNESARVAAANAIFTALPMSLDTVRFVTPETLTTLNRPDVRRVQTVDELFDRLEEKGISVVSVEITRRQAVFYFGGGGPDWRRETQDAARVVADYLPPPIDSVRFVRLDDVTRVTSGVPAAPDLASGASRPQYASGDEVPLSAVLSDADRQAIAEMLFEELSAEDFLVDGLQLTRYRATVFVRPLKFREAARNIGRAARVVANNVPASVEEIVIVTMDGGLELNRVMILRRDLESAVANRGSPEEIWARASIGEPLRMFLPRDAIKNRRRYPSFGWSFGPTLRQHIGSGEDFYLYGVFATLTGGVEIARGLSVNAVASRVLYDQFDRITTESPSTLQKVRSDIKEYLQQGEQYLVRFQTDYLFMPLPNVYGRFSAGIFEEMFGGYGGEFLYRPFGSRFAAGFDVNWVRQRAFNQRRTFLPYTVITGHMNIYYDMPWYNLFAEVNIGQYLARDRGATFQMSRQFDSGVRMGAWATLTSVSFEQFGEGSFDKGFFIVVPFELFSIGSSQSEGLFSFRPLTKDGGQRLNVGPRLFDVTARGNLNVIARDWDRFLD